MGGLSGEMMRAYDYVAGLDIGVVDYIGATRMRQVTVESTMMVHEINRHRQSRHRSNGYCYAFRAGRRELPQYRDDGRMTSRAVHLRPIVEDTRILSVTRRRSSIFKSDESASCAMPRHTLRSKPQCSRQ